MRRIQAKIINLEHTKSTKYHYHVLMTKDLFQKMVFICLLIFMDLKKKTHTNEKNIFNKKRDPYR